MQLYEIFDYYFWFFDNFVHIVAYYIFFRYFKNENHACKSERP